MSQVRPALDAESTSLHNWLGMVQRLGQVNHPDIPRVKERLKQIEDEKKRDKRQAKRAKKLWGTVLETIEQHDPVGAQSLRKLAKSPDDKAALAGVGTAIAAAAGKDHKLAQTARVVMPMIQQLFVDNDDDTED